MTRARPSLPKAATEASPHVVLHTHSPGPSQKTSRSEQSALFSAGEKCETPHETLHRQLLEEAMRDQDLGGAGHHAELECQRSALRLLLNSDLGENLENLHRYHDEELECRRSAPQTRRNTVQGENLEDVHQYHPKRELQCRRAAQQAA